MKLTDDELYTFSELEIYFLKFPLELFLVLF